MNTYEDEKINPDTIVYKLATYNKVRVELPKTSLQNVLEHHKNLCDEARSIVATKGHDYNKVQQENKEDTLGNMRLAKHIGLADSCCQSTMIRLLDKFMRLASLTKNPESISPQTQAESVHDTIRDAINYLVYLDIFYNEESNSNNKNSK